MANDNVSSALSQTDIWGTPPSGGGSIKVDGELDLLFMRPQNSPIAVAAARNFNQNLQNTVI